MIIERILHLKGFIAKLFHKLKKMAGIPVPKYDNQLDLDMSTFIKVTPSALIMQDKTS
jgi:hypothetical protein